MKKQLSIRLIVVPLLFNTVPIVAQSDQWHRTGLSDSWPIYALAAAPTTPTTLLCEDGFTIYRSSNAGTNWSSVSPFAAFPGNAIAADAINPNTVYSGRSHGMMKSTDGGVNWFNLTDLNAGPGADAIVIDPGNSDIVYAGVGAGGGVYKSGNAGATWANPLTSVDVEALAINPANTLMLYGGTQDYYGV